MLDVVHISKSYGHAKVLDDVSFQVKPGTLVGITGENGSGKSTLLNIIMGMLSADQGTVHTSGRVGYCPQEPRLFSSLTVNENYRYFASAYGLHKNRNGEAVNRRYEDFLCQFGLLTYRYFRVEQLSGGTRQKINLMISLMHDPDVYILDEPYGGFDWDTYQLFWKVLLQLKEKGKCLLLVTHLLNDLKHFDHVLTLERGKLV